MQFFNKNYIVLFCNLIVFLIIWFIIMTKSNVKKTLEIFSYKIFYCGAFVLEPKIYIICVYEVNAKLSFISNKI